jgi:hypothetical protein
VTARDFEPGERVEVDYAGDALEWVELSTGEIHKAYVFVAGLGFSQLLFAWAAEDTRDVGEWKQVKLHPDCYVQLESAHYRAPHIHRSKLLRVKLTEHHVEIFLALERLAVHPRCRHRDGRRMKIDAHFPPASQAYYEATPQKLLSQARLVHPELHRLVVDLFNAEVYGNIRRVQGLIRSATKELQACGREQASLHIEAAIAQMRHFDKVRVPYFQMLLAQARHHKTGDDDATRAIVRLPGNPMLRYVRGNTAADDPAHPNQEKLKL